MICVELCFGKCVAGEALLREVPEVPVSSSAVRDTMSSISAVFKGPERSGYVQVCEAPGKGSAPQAMWHRQEVFHQAATSCRQKAMGHCLPAMCVRRATLLVHHLNPTGKQPATKWRHMPCSGVVQSLSAPSTKRLRQMALCATQSCSGQRSARCCEQNDCSI